MVVGVGAALYYKLRLIGALGVGSIEAERGDDEHAPLLPRWLKLAWSPEGKRHK